MAIWPKSGKPTTLPLNMPTTSKLEVWLQDFKGISYYIDGNMNVYQTEDIVSNKRNPKVIAKYIIDGGNYSIPSNI